MFKGETFLTPVHIAFFHLLIDPACPLVLESVPDRLDAMFRPPRPTGATPFTRIAIGYAVGQGAGA